LDKQLLDWRAQTGKVFNVAYLIDRAYPDTSCTGCLFSLFDMLMNQDPYDALTTKVNEFYSILVNSSSSTENQAIIGQHTKRLNDIFTCAMEKIDSIMTRQLAARF
jgi:hypothetical protein